jgi:hypothetical protein
MVFCIIVLFVGWKEVFDPLEPLVLPPPALMPGIHCSTDSDRNDEDLLESGSGIH